MEIGSIDITAISSMAYPTVNLDRSVGTAELEKAFDTLFLKQLWGGLLREMSGESEGSTGIGPWGDVLFSQIVEGLADRQSLGFGRLLLAGRNT